MVDRLDRLLFTRDLGPLPEAHTHFCDVLAGIYRRFPIDVVSHRFLTVPRHRAWLLVDDDIARQLADPTELGPSFVTPPSYGLVLARTQFDCPQIACSDTAFYDPMPEERTSYPLPASWGSRHDVRRRGFHGLSHEHVARRAGQILSGAAVTRLISCHIGPTSSVTALRSGVPVDTTLGFVPGDAMLGASSGGMDAGALLRLIIEDDVAPAALRHLLEENAGMAALAGRTRTLADLVADAESGDPDAHRAVDIHQHGLAAAIAGLTASLGGLDALVFTGPYGCRDPWLRSDLARRLRYLGVRIDPARNQALRGDLVLSDPGGVAVAVVESRLDLRMVAEARQALRDTSGRTGQRVVAA
ncbi:MAG: hypothetical protein WCA46_10605 [Actinocatenispora sp.]